MNPFERDWKSVTTEDGKKAYTEIVIVFDKSGSMESMKQAVVDGFNEYAEKVRAVPGDNRWTLVMFDDPASARGADEAFPQVLFESQPERTVPLLCLPKTHSVQFGFASGSCSRVVADEVSGHVPFQPRGWTALTDALCETIDRTALRTSGMDHIKVVMGIFTDGGENNSRKHTSAALRERIAAMQAKRGWDFLYFGANQDAFLEAGNAGLPGAMISGHLPAGASYTNNFVATVAGMRQAIGSGFMGMYSVASGSLCSGRVSSSPQPTAVVGVSP